MTSNLLNSGRKPTGCNAGLSRRQWLQGAAALACTTALGARAQGQSPADSSAASEDLRTNPFETLDLDWLDSARERPVPARLYLPMAAAATPLPLVLFSHGLGGSRRGYSWLGQHFASQGMASLHVQHVGSDRDVWFGSVWGLLGRLQSAAQDAEALARVQDLRFALDTLLAGPQRDHIDAGRIVVAGHSYGANTALLACGATVQRAGRVLDLADRRLRAAIVISAPPFYGQAEPQRILRSVTVPTLHITATEDVIRIPGYSSGVEDRLALFEATGSARKWLAVFEGGSHSMFTDRGGTGGVTLNPMVKAATRDLASAFVRGVFEGDESGLMHWPARHAGILARFASPA
jgi:predicted dienelactone hydrolase